MHPDSRLLHLQEPDIPRTRTINPELYRGSTVLFKCYSDLLQAGQGQYPGVTYGTDRLPQQRVLEEALCTLEGAALTRVYPSGISAISEALLMFVRNGDHVLVCDNVYSPTARFCHEILAKFGVQTEYIPSDTGSDIAHYIRPNTRLIFLESPGSNTFELQDIPAITAEASKRGIITVLDNTWATPLFLQPFQLGIDATIHSITKYLSGHSDLLMGSISVCAEHAELLAKTYACREIYASPDDCLLTLRGLRTLHLRMQAHQTSALAIAAALADHPLVDQVLHPALPVHPQHHLWKRDFTGSAGLFAITLKREYPEVQLAQFIDNLQCFGIGYSWGGFMSLITAGKPARHFTGPLTGRTIIRLNIGLENTEDLLTDLQQSLARLDD